MWISNCLSPIWWKSIDCIYVYMWVYFWSLYSAQWSICLCPYTNTILLWLCNKYWSQLVEVFQLCCSFSKLFWAFYLLCISRWILESSWHFLQKSLLGFLLDCIECIDQFGRNWHQQYWIFWFMNVVRNVFSKVHSLMTLYP